MTDQEPPEDQGDLGRIEEPRSEGVRIIGAQEAAEAVGRPDVARRRRRGEKRFGDRPDEPEPAADLPKVRISTSEPTPEPDPGDRFGAIPVVRPPGGEPRWAGGDPSAATSDLEPERTYGHARPIPAEPEPADEPDEGSRPGEWDPGPGPVSGDPYLRESEFDDQPGDDSFVLPHWTEPPTGQVPKVVIGDDQPEAEVAASSGSQPRWRDEGERTVDTDFDDLVDDGPPLGALGGDPLPDPDLDVDFFDGEQDRDPLEAFAPEERPFGDDRPSRRRPAATRGRAARSEDEFADGLDGDGDRPERTSSGSGDRNLPVAVGVGVALLVLGLVCFSLGGFATTLLACLIVGVAAFEFFGAVQARGYQPAALLGLVSVVGLLLATYFSGLGAYPVVLTLTVVLGLLWYLWVTPGEHSVRNLGITLLGVMWIGFLGSFATLFLGLGKVIEDSSASVTSNPGIGVLIAAVIVAVGNDVGAYFVGRYAGKTPMSAASPNKTLEGLAGGVVTAIVLTVVVVGFFGIAPIGGDIFRVFVFALLCAVVAPLGDLCESFIKRDLGIKDMGSVLPGHGGVLDRFDGLLFVLPTAYFVTVLFNTWGGG